MPIGTTAAILIGLGTAAGQAASNVYGARSAARTNQQAIAAERAIAAENAHRQAEEAARQEALERERMAQEERIKEAERVAAEKARTEALAASERARTESLALDRQRWNDYVAANKPKWELSERIYGSLLDMVGGLSGGGGGGGFSGGGGGGVTSMMPTGGIDTSASLFDTMQGAVGGETPSRGRTIAERLPAATPQPAAGGLSLAQLMEMAQMTGPRAQA